MPIEKKAYFEDSNWLLQRLQTKRNKIESLCDTQRQQQQKQMEALELWRLQTCERERRKS